MNRLNKPSEIGIELVLIVGIVITATMYFMSTARVDDLEGDNYALISENMQLIAEVGDIKAANAMMLSDLSFMSGAITGHMFEELTALNVQRMGRALRQVLEDKKSLLEMDMKVME